MKGLFHRFTNPRRDKSVYFWGSYLLYDNLDIEVGRHHGLPRYDRLCRLCKDEVENEIHFMLQRPVYETLRQKYLPKILYISECKQV